MEVLYPKPLNTPTEVGVVRWARNQLELASQIIDNPGGGLLSATQAIGQVRAALAEIDEERWAKVGELLLAAEDAGVRRRYDSTRERLAQAIDLLEQASSEKPAEAEEPGEG